MIPPAFANFSYSPRMSRRKGGSSWIASSLWSRRSPNFWTSESCFVLSKWFIKCKHLFIEKPMVITKPAVPTARLGLGWKLYPAKMLRLVNKDLAYLSLSRVRQNRASERKTLLTGFPVRSFCRPKWQTSTPFPLSYTWSLIEVSLSGGASPFRH